MRSGLCRTAELVTSRELPLAQTVIGSLYSAGLLVGACLGGVVTATWGTSATLLIDGASFVVSALLVAKIKRPFSSAMATRRLRIGADTAELWRFLRTTPVASALMWLTAGLRLCYGMVGLLPLYALERFHVGDAGVGPLYLAQGLGAVLGPFVGRRLTGGSTHRRLYVAAAALAIFGLGYLLLAHSTHLGPGMAAALVGHIGVGACAILALNGLQLTTPDHIRGRVMVFVFSLVRVTGGVDTCGRTHGRDHRDDRYHSSSWGFRRFLRDHLVNRVITHQGRTVECPHKGTFEA
ncbi:MFS transporter [Nonomuraea sp. NPDC048882]|uniref:MFS transporter n=1 Tax=Nonomuraea sp. NPDC048882 TaxID=3154347 RepID=UPI0033CE56B6